MRMPRDGRLVVARRFEKHVSMAHGPNRGERAREGDDDAGTRLEHEGVGRGAERRTRDGRQIGAAVHAAGEWLKPSAIDPSLDAKRISVEIPTGFTRLLSAEPDLALAWRMAPVVRSRKNSTAR